MATTAILIKERIRRKEKGARGASLTHQRTTAGKSKIEISKMVG